ncbi:LptF/LptG family permease [Deinococcus deserti]|uniref:Putative membrane protein putative permease n=1 Tax=Deinococcus deserti (strain DSM 17065 / CIP 109153 / LMG 22923 / VCD115) TaxID=546414 RepID=C1D092_DEIDV|nr:putative membrane protein; putative permease [Deinococcus deserti VCD115]
MPSILTRFVLREVLRWYAAGAALFLTLQMTDVLSTTVAKLLTYDPPLWKAVAAFGAILPTILNRTLVLAVPFAILLAFSRMQRDSEFKAILAAGVRPLSLVWPLLAPFAVVGLIAGYNAGTLVPAGLKQWDRAWYRIYEQTPPPPTQEHYTFAPAGALYYASRIVNAKGGDRAELTGVMVQRGEETLTATSGVWDAKARTWTLQNAWVVRPGQPPRQKTGALVLPQRDTLQPPPAEGKQLSNAQLRAGLKRELSPAQRRDYQYQLATRVADPVTPVVFALAAGALGLLIRSRATAFAAVLVFIASFYILWSTAPQLARAGAMDPALAAWLPNLTFLLLAGVLAWRLR